MPERSPIEDAIRSLLGADLLDALDRHHQQYDHDLAEAESGNARAREWIRTVCLGRPTEHPEAELEREYADLLAHHRGRFVARIRAVLEDWALRFAAADCSPAGNGRAA